jgi:cerevisin
MSDVIKGVEYAAKFHLAEQDKARKEGKVFKGSGANMSLGGGRSRTLDEAVDGVRILTQYVMYIFMYEYVI